MTTISRILFVVILTIAATSNGQEYHFRETRDGNHWYGHQRYDQWDFPLYPYQTEPYVPQADRWDRGERFYYSDGYNGRKPGHRRRRHREMAPSGWDIRPDLARQAPNCYRYSLTVTGGRGSARIEQLPGKNYIQTSGQKTGYVCFNGPARLELGKLANPNIEVQFRLKDVGVFVFTNGDRGRRQINNWYRTYWDF
ncbi:MAG: hypothetical protein CSB23_01615 [Deltaproteobacteria bacterium]|nr:MAG: hypothetical protein CSB23_01615 [Deltaproteobacteria bacterium]